MDLRHAFEQVAWRFLGLLSWLYGSFLRLISKAAKAPTPVMSTTSWKRKKAEAASVLCLWCLHCNFSYQSFLPLSVSQVCLSFLLVFVLYLCICVCICLCICQFASVPSPQLCFCNCFFCNSQSASLPSISVSQSQVRTGSARRRDNAWDQ